MSDIEASGAALQTATDALAAAGAEIDRILTELDTEVAGLRGAWSGAASDAYDDAHRRWTAELQQMRAYVADYSNRLDEIDQRYRQADKTITGKIWS